MAAPRRPAAARRAAGGVHAPQTGRPRPAQPAGQRVRPSGPHVEPGQPGGPCGAGGLRCHRTRRTAGPGIAGLLAEYVVVALRLWLVGSGCVAQRNYLGELSPTRCQRTAASSSVEALCSRHWHLIVVLVGCLPAATKSFL